ncbi:tetratricopeptide repeat protein [Arsukibacterium indicum]|uniref:Tetratricopeptide repeat protein n=1 Tax=Arsukibacterium indicum TaxID=2848612 RepID=A0ABS6MH96_9GAMM|nr:tetratricopeptide repeat protein [Arsukibacterium indicum]MBV2128010.1 tetratricopeptide repeat protein [Arsukibacterium indicum]
MKKYFVFFAFMLCLHVQANVYQPAATDKLALAAPLPLTAEMAEFTSLLANEPDQNTVLELSALYLQGARKPGFDAWFHEAEQLLDSLNKPYTGLLQYQLLIADIQQQQHQFQAALKTLDAVFKKEPQHVTASLMAARIYLAIAEHDAAQQACARLWQQDLFLLSVCSYEVAGRKGNWATSYPALLNLFKRQATMPLAIEIWVRGILAEQAEQLGKIEVAQQWLSPVLSQAPTSLWLKWADLSLQLGDAALVFDKLAALQQNFGIADSLLVRLVRAGQQLTLAHDNAQALTFATELTQRVAVRVARGDSDHAADLAHYFLHIEPDAAAALYWAKLNYQSAKEPDDLALLEQSIRALAKANQITEADK